MTSIWLCSSKACGQSNYFNVDRCEKCDSVRRSSAVSIPSTCTVKIPTSSAPRMSSVVQSPVGGWHCARCTLINDCSSSQCAICAYVRPGMPGIPKSLSVVDVSNISPASQILPYGRHTRPTQSQSAHGLSTMGTTTTSTRVEALQIGPEAEWWTPVPSTSSLVLFKGEPGAEDIVQGGLGNCWFMSSLAVLCERPDLIRRLFVESGDQLSRTGLYTVQLCLDGIWQLVQISASLPVHKRRRRVNGDSITNELVYCRTNRGQLWVPYIEKAMATAYGSYEKLRSGRCIESLLTLTGAPCHSMRLRNRPTHEGGSAVNDGHFYDDLWAQLESCRMAGFLMGASCGAGPDDVDESRFSTVGLQAQHAYSVLAAECHGTTHWGPVRLMKLRNPWGAVRWCGDWSDNSPKWQSEPQLKHHCMPYGANQGVFWMEFGDFCRYFDGVDICKVQKYGSEYRIRVALEPDMTKNTFEAISVVVTDRSEIDLCVIQPNSRQNNEAKQEVDICIAMFEQKSNGSFGKLVMSSARSISLMKNCHKFVDAGQFLVVAFSFNGWNVGFGGAKGTIVCHSIAAVFAEKIQLSTEKYFPAIRQLMIAKGKLSITRMSDQSAMAFVYTMGGDWAGFATLVENRMTDLNLLVKCDCSENQNIVSTRSDVTFDSIPPHHSQLVMLLTQLEPTQSYCVSHSLKLKATNRPNLKDWAPPDPPMVGGAERRHVVSFGFTTLFGHEPSNCSCSENCFCSCSKLHIPEIDQRNCLLHSPKFTD